MFPPVLIIQYQKLVKLVHFDQKNPNLMSISVRQNQKPLIIQKKQKNFQIIKCFRIELTKKINFCRWISYWSILM